MDLKRLAPWNWFKKEQETQQTALPVRRVESGGTSREAVESTLPTFLSPVLQLQREIDRLFNEAFRSFGLGWPTTMMPSLPSAEWQSFLRPVLDIYETETQYNITLELPGVEPKDVHITLDEDVLFIQGEKRHAQEYKDSQQHRIERAYGAFQRMLNLPDDADPDNIKASFQNGVLRLTIGKRTPSRPQRGRPIPIEH
jgi:HSP20 family protein